MSGGMGEGEPGASVAKSVRYAAGDICDGLPSGRPDRPSILITILLLIVFACAGQAVGSDGGARNLIELETSFPWIDQPLDVNYSVVLRSFVYGSAAWPWAKHAYGCDSYFLYYEADLLEETEVLSASLHAKGREVYVVLDPEPPEEGTTFLDLCYDLSLWRELADQLDSTIATLSGLGVELTTASKLDWTVIGIK